MDEPSQPIDLAHDADFELGPLKISPSTCRVYDGAREDRIEARVMAVLVALARAAPRTVTREELMEACWDGRVVSDDAIARALGKLRALARSRTPAAFSIETVTKVGFRLVLASPLVAATTAAAPPRADWRAFALLAASLLLVAALVAAFTLRAPMSRQTYVTIVAFEQRDDGMGRLAGLTQDALLETAAASGISIFAANSAEMQNAEFTIKGSLHRESGSPVVTVRLEHTNSGLAVWTHTFTAGPDGESALADMASARSIGVLQCTLTERARERRRIAPASLAQYLRVCDAAVSGDLEQMMDTSRALTSMAPANATAHALLAYALAGASGMTRTPAEIAALRAEARYEAERALSLDRRQPRAYLALADALEDPTAWAERERLLQRALALDPRSTTAANAYTHFLRQVGRLRDALAVSERVHDGEHSANSGLPLLSLLRASQGDLRGGYEAVDRYARIYPVQAPRLRWTILVWWDDVARARRLNTVWGETLPETSVACFDAVFARVTAGPRGGALDSTCALLPDDWKARMLSRMGNVDEALRLLDAPERLQRRSTIGLFYPEMSAVRADARFVDVARRHGLLEYWRDAGKTPDFCSREAQAPVCQLVAGEN